MGTLPDHSDRGWPRQSTAENWGLDGKTKAQAHQLLSSRSFRTCDSLAVLVNQRRAPE